MNECTVSELVLDFDLYPRNHIDTQHVAYMKEAAKTGCVFPPIVADQKSKRVTDGFHRTRMYEALYGADHKVEVLLKRYKTEGDMFLDACRYNATHGNALTTADRTRCTIIAARLEVDSAALAGSLHVPMETLERLRVDRTATSPNGKGVHVALKRTIKHKAGGSLTKEQVSANDKLSGMQQAFYVNQIITLIENDLLDTSDRNLLERLGILRGLLSKMEL